jgi:hypothetical protein
VTVEVIVMRIALRSFLVIGSVALGTALQTVARAGDPVGPVPVPVHLRPPAPLPHVKSPAPTTPKPVHTTETASSDADGIVQLVDETLSSVALRPDQAAALPALGADADAKVGAVDRARDDFMLALADEIDAGNRVTSETLAPEIQKVSDAAAAASVALRSDLKKLHDLLDPEQRLEFVAGFREALHERASLVEPTSQSEEWSKALSLTDDQKQKVLAIVGEDKVDDDVEKARADVVLAAFPGGAFSMDDLLPASSVRRRAQHMLANIVTAADKVTAILTPDQRSMAAAKIRERASGTSADDTTVRPTPSSEKATSVSEPLWVGRGGRYYGGAYRRAGAFGFSRTYATGFGGIYLL